MFRRSLLIVLGVSLALSSTALAGQNAAKKAKKSAAAGVVVTLQKDKDKDSGSITIKIHPKKGAEPTTEAKEEKFIVTPSTKFEKVIHIAKGDNKREKASFKDVAVGEHVVVIHGKDNKTIATQVD